MISIYGMLSPKDMEEGYDLALDEDWYAVLLKEEEVLARFDPRDYTVAELHEEVEKLLEPIRGKIAV